MRCPDCRTRRKDYGLFTRHLRETGHRVCTCGGYHHAHRPGSPFCERNPTSPVLLASRYGASDDELVDIAIDCALIRPGKLLRTNQEIPF